jgi:hypothetical protein
VGTSFKVEEPEKCPAALPLPLQLKFWKWGLGSSSKYFHGTQVIVTHLPYHGPYKATLHSSLREDSARNSSDDYLHSLLPPAQGPLEIPETSATTDSRTHIHDERRSQVFQQPFQSSHSATQKNGETQTAPSPTSLHVMGTYFHYPSPDSDVPSRSSESTLPQSTDMYLSLEVSRSNSTSVTAITTYIPPISPEPIYTVPSPSLRGQLPERSMIVFLPRRGDSAASRRLSSKQWQQRKAESGVISLPDRSPKSFYYRRASAHGGRGKPILERNRKSFRNNFPTPSLRDSLAQRNPAVQATLRAVGIDDDTILKRDRRVRISCCREDARYCIFVHRLILMLSNFEEVSYFLNLIVRLSNVITKYPYCFLMLHLLPCS